MLVGSGVFISLLSSCASLPVYKTSIIENKIKIPVALFTENKLQILKVQNSLYDIAVRKERETKFIALQLRCTHADNALSATGKGFICNLHGSTFSSDGNVTKGPAEFDLKKYRVELAGNEVLVFID